MFLFSMKEEEKVDGNSNAVKVEENVIEAEEEKENIDVPITPEPEIVDIQKQETPEREPEDNVSNNLTSPEPINAELEPNENVPPVRCNSQANKPQHLDLKFYHSSLW